MEDERGACFQRGLGMAYQQMNGDGAGADEAAGECADRASNDGSNCRTGTDSAAILDTITLGAGVGLDGAFADDMGAGAGRSGDFSMQAVAGAVGQDDGVRLEAHGAGGACVAGGNGYDAAIDFRTGGDDDLAALQHIGRNAGAEGLALFDLRGGKAVEQADENVGAFLQFARTQRMGMNDVAIGIVGLLIVGALIEAGSAVGRRRGWSNMHDAVVSTVAGGREVDGGING